MEDYIQFRRDYVALHGVLTSLGFATERAEKAVSVLLAEPEAERNYERKRILSVKDVCQTLSISKSSLRRLMDSGKLRAIQISQYRIGFRPRDIDAFVDSLGYHE